MPDCHVGYGVTIGCVFPTGDAVLPERGRGRYRLRHVRGPDRHRATTEADGPAVLARLGRPGCAQRADRVRHPHARPQELGGLDRPLRASGLQPLLREKAAVQLGTLGGGNHFLEAQVDEAGQIWLMVHSGSRHTGLRIADHYNRPGHRQQHAARARRAERSGLAAARRRRPARTTCTTWTGRRISPSRAGGGCSRR